MISREPSRSRVATFRAWETGNTRSNAPQTTSIGISSWGSQSRSTSHCPPSSTWLRSTLSVASRKPGIHARRACSSIHSRGTRGPCEEKLTRGQIQYIRGQDQGIDQPDRDRKRYFDVRLVAAEPVSVPLPDALFRSSASPDPAREEVRAGGTFLGRIVSGVVVDVDRERRKASRPSGLPSSPCQRTARHTASHSYSEPPSRSSPAQPCSFSSISERWRFTPWSSSG